MKRTAAILLCGILLFNWFGYRLLTSYMEDHVNSSLEAQLDVNNYDESQLISIKVPAVHLPYYTNSKQFERVDGQIEIEGVQYKYVKRRLYDDSLELMCIPNHDVMKLQTARDDFFKLVNDLQHPAKGKKNDAPGASKGFSFDYYTAIDPYTIGNYALLVEKPASDYAVATLSCYYPTAEQPPDYHFC